MKKFILTAAVAAVTLCANAQKSEGDDHKPFKAEVAIGYAFPTGGIGSSGGVLFAAEPKYAVSPKISVGVRFEAAVTVSGLSGFTTDAYGDYYSDSDPSANTAVSFLGTADYYFTNRDFKPFAGVGAGVYHTNGVDIGSSSSGSNTAFGGMVRAGIEYKHLRAALEYNLVSKTSVDADNSDPDFVVPAYDIKNSYIGIKIGVLIGGGRR